MVLNMKKEFRLIISAKIGDWSGGWAAGSIIAHYFHYKKYGKVFWYQHLHKKGLGDYYDEIDENWDSLRKHPGETADGAFISDIGYFYSTETGDIRWQYKLEKILKQNEISKEGKKYIPAFREVYYDEHHEHPHSWYLISDLRQLKKPIKCGPGCVFKFLYPGGKLVPLEAKDHLMLNCFVSVFPALIKEDLYEPDEKDLQDPHLKELLITGLSDKHARLHEFHVQNAILSELYRQGYTFSKEGFVEEKESGSKGRYDFLVKKNGKYFAIETKVDDDVNAAAQLEDYIDKIVKKGEITEDQIQGVIICGRPSDKTKDEADRRKFKVYEYKLEINIPSIIDNL
jgi:hypothetical protein